MRSFWLRLTLLMATVWLFNTLCLPGPIVQAAPNPLAESGIKAYAAGAYAQAANQLARAIELEPRNAQARFYYGLSLGRLQRYEPARAQFEQVVQLLPATDPIAKKARNNAALMTRQSVTLASAATGGNAAVTANAARLVQAEQANRQASQATNYLSHVIQNGQVVQWKTTQGPLKVFVANAQSLPTPALKELVGRACQEWSLASGQTLRFVAVNDSSQADITVRWSGAMSQERLGVSPFKSIGNSIVQSDVIVALKDPDGRPMTLEQLYPVVLHEFGHALGLQGHSPYPEDVMFFSASPQQVTQLTRRDRKTFQMLYALTPTITNRSAVASVAQNRQAMATAQQALNLLNSKQYDQAAQVSLSGLQHWPEHPDLLFSAGASFQNLGQTDRAKQFYERALRVEPNHLNARQNLNRLIGNS